MAHFLNSIRYEQRQWGPVQLAAAVFVRGQYGGAADRARTWLPFAAVMSAGLFWGGRGFLLTWALLAAASTAWFLAYSALSNKGNARILSV